MGSYTHLSYHIVFGTKYRRRYLSESIKKQLYEFIGGTLRAQKGHLIQIGGVEDHVHILTTLSSSIAVANVIRDVKSNSSKWICQHSNNSHFQWQIGYGAFSVSYSLIESVREYIAKQKELHRVTTFQEEYIEFLKRHNIKFRKEYLFEDEHHG